MMRTISVRHLFVLAACAVMLMLPIMGANAQERGTGQFWVTVYEDRNSDGTRSAGEPLVTRGVNVELRDSAGVVVASALLEPGSSPSPGMVGFQYLLPGTYTLVVSSPELTPTTPSEFTTTIQEGAMPVVVEFGGTRSVTTTTDAADTLTAVDAERQTVARLAISGLGALMVIGFMSAVGIVLYGFVLRSRLVPIRANAAQTAAQMAARDAYIRATQTQTGSMRAVDPRDTGAHRAADTTGSMRAVQPQQYQPQQPPQQPPPIQQSNEMFMPPRLRDNEDDGDEGNR